MKQLTDENFKEHTQDGVHVIDLWANWCGPCKMYGPIFEGVAKSFDGEGDVALYKVDIDTVPGLSTELGITSVPATVFIKDGEVVETLTGVQMANALTEAITNLRDS